MDKSILTRLVNDGNSIRSIASIVKCSYTNVRYWLKRFGLTTIRKTVSPSDLRTCPRCGETKLRSEFYQRRGVFGASVYCKICSCKQAVERQQKFKQQCIDYLGSKCEICGYNKCINALEFHHKDPTTKDFTISNLKLTTFSDKVRKELDKCALLCANCHREVHSHNTFSS